MELSDAMEKTPVTPGIDPGTVRLVAKGLNHYATPGVAIYFTNHYLHVKVKVNTLYRRNTTKG